MKKLFILHGWTYTTEKWQALVEQVRAKGFEVVQLTVPGLTEATDRVWTLENYVDWLKERLASEDQPILIGHSNGGRIALAYAAQYPTKLSRLILVCSAGIYHNELPLRLKRFVFGTLAKLGKKLTSSPTLRNALYRLARESDYKNATPQMRETMSNLITVDLIPRLPSIVTPTLIIWGEQDRLTPVSDAHLLHQLLQNSTLHILKDAGHSPHFTHAQEVSTFILNEIQL